LIVNQRRLNVSLLRSPTVHNRIPGCQWFTTVQIQTLFFLLPTAELTLLLATHLES
jgi:hypothetical protein